MNEFISNSGTLINPDSVYDQERFINILQIILQKKTQKELSEQTGLNNATIFTNAQRCPIWKTI